MIKGQEGSHVGRSKYFSLKRFIIVDSKVSVIVLHTSWTTSEEDAIYDNASSIVEKRHAELHCFTVTLLYPGVRCKTAASREIPKSHPSREVYH